MAVTKPDAERVVLLEQWLWELEVRLDAITHLSTDVADLVNEMGCVRRGEWGDCGPFTIGPLRTAP